MGYLSSESLKAIQLAMSVQKADDILTNAALALNSAILVLDGQLCGPLGLGTVEQYLAVKSAQDALIKISASLGQSSVWSRLEGAALEESTF